MKKHNNHKIIEKKSNLADFQMGYIIIILVLASFIYLKSLNGEFLNWDDNDVVVYNDAVKNLNFEKIIFFFTNIYSNDYRPITFISYGLIYSVWGLNPVPFHFFCVLFHLINIVLVFLLVKKISHSKTVPVLTALIFAVHPMLVESVAWISALNDVLYAFFLLSALLFYIQYINSNQNLKYLLFCFLLFSLSAFTKPLGIVIPFLLFLFDYFLKRKFSPKVFYEKIPFISLSLVFILITFVSRESEVITALKSFSLFDRFFFVFYSLSFYLTKFLFPFALSSLHDFPVKENNVLPLVYYLSPLLIAALFFLFYKMKKHRTLLVFGFLFFLINIGLVVQIIPFGKFIVAERYTYVPYIGLSFIASSFFCIILQKINKTYYTPMQLLGALFLLFFIISSFNRVKVWNNSFALWEDVLKKNPMVAIAHNQIGLLHYFDGDYKNAIAHFDTAISYDNEFYVAFNNRGSIHLNLNENDKALEDFNSAISINPEYSDAYYNIGYINGEEGKTEIAIEYYNQAISNNSDNFNAYFNRGLEYVKINKYEQAVADFSSFIDARKNDPDAFYNRAIAYMNLNQYSKALIDFDAVTRLQPNNSNAYYNKGIINYYYDNLSEACINFRKAGSLGHPEAAGKITELCN
ncbi:MAG: tetratricopeptide repeat protein [Bacteroidales bacterium]|nr:tetratricopeptide repeat protein [Bacteroidales bacterium]